MGRTGLPYDQSVLLVLFITLITDRQYQCTGLAVPAILQDSKGVETGDFNKRLCSYGVDPRANVFSKLYMAKR